MSTTWSNIQRHMRERFRLAEDTPEMMAMVWTYDDGRSQKIIVRRYQAFEREMVEFKSPFARKGEVDPHVLLADSAKLPLATVALSGDVYLAVYNALLDGLTLEDLDFMLERVADVADALEEKYASQDAF